MGVVLSDLKAVYGRSSLYVPFSAKKVSSATTSRRRFCRISAKAAFVAAASVSGASLLLGAGLGGRPGWTVSAKGRRTRLRFMSLHAVATSTDVSSRPRPNDSAGPIFLSSKPSHVSERAATSGDQVNHSAKTESRDSLRSSGTRRRIRHKRLNHISNAVNFTPQVKFFTKASC